MAKMTSTEFIKKLRNVADNHKTVYALGMFGQPITGSIIQQKAKQLPNWYTNQRQTALAKLIGEGYFGFDCVCLIKAILWGWSGKTNATNGGATYNSNGVPDIGTDEMINQCSGVSTNFSNIVPGEVVWIEGHIGVYIGDGKVIECTPKWTNDVQYSNLGNIAKYKKGNYRTWTKHGKLPWIDYTVKAETKPITKTVTVTLKELKKGDKNAQVKVMQTLLIASGFSCGSAGADGDFGSDTEKAVKAFQKSLKKDASGVCGVGTWSALLKAS